MTGGLLARLHPELMPVRKDQEPEQRPGPRSRVLDSRPEWLRRSSEGLLRAKELAR